MSSVTTPSWGGLGRGEQTIDWVKRPSGALNRTLVPPTLALPTRGREISVAPLAPAAGKRAMHQAFAENTTPAPAAINAKPSAWRQVIASPK